VLQRYARTSDLLIIATDNDREGENIGFEIIEVCKAGLTRAIPTR
jgi:DNA topoisomerase IA